MNISHRLQEMSRRYPDKKSVILAKDHSYYTFSQFEERSNQICHRLVKLGIRPGMRTLLFVRPCLDFSVITFSLFKMGAIPVLIDPGMGIKNLLQSVRGVKPEALISVGEVHWLRRIKSEFFSNVKVKVSLHPVGGRTHYLYKNLSSEPKEFSPLSVQSEDTAAILFTSGGTGIPKGVIYTHGILNAQTDLLKEMFKLGPEEVDLAGFPLFALFTLAMGMSSVIPQMNPARPGECDAKKMVKNIQDHQVSFVAGSPIIWERVARFCLTHKIKLPSVKKVVMFGAPVRGHLHEMYREILPEGDTYTPYGATECLPVSLARGEEILEHHLPKMKLGEGTFIGSVVPRTRAKIIKVSDIPSDKIIELEGGEIGEIIVTGDQVTPSYFEMEEETKLAKILYNGEIWHRMGDLGYLDQEGELWFLGRKAHRVVTEKEVFYPIRVEAIFNQHPEIRRSALVKIILDGQIQGAVVIERHDQKTTFGETFMNDLLKLKNASPYTENLKKIFLHPDFPVDVRHNIKIDRVKLSHWAQERVESGERLESRE